MGHQKMNRANEGLLVLIPHGIDLERQPNPQSEQDCTDGQNEKIIWSRRAFLTRCGMNANETRVSNERLCCKPAFLLRYADKLNSYQVLGAILSDRATLFSQKYAVYWLNHGEMWNRAKVKKSQHQKWEAYCRKNDMQDAQMKKTVEGFDQWVRNRNESVFRYEEKLRKEVEKAENALAMDEMRAVAIGRVMRKWLSQREDDNIDLVQFYDYFRKWCAFRRSVAYEKAESLPFREHYQVRQYEEYARYIKRRTTFDSMWKGIQQWNAHSRFPIRKSEKRPHLQPVFSDETIQEVSNALQEYKAHVRTQVQEIDPERVRDVLQKAYIKPGLAPIRFLILCVQGSMALFSKNHAWEDIAPEKIGNFAKTASECTVEQRVARLRLMLAVCHALSTCAEDVEVNLLYFWRYHGYGILPAAEAEVWRNCLQHYRLQDSMAGFPIFCIDNLQACLYTDPTELWYYSGGSRLQQGGFAAFYREFPDAVHIVATYLKRHTPKLSEAYLKQWTLPNSMTFRDVRSKVQKTAMKKLQLFNTTVEPDDGIQEGKSAAKQESILPLEMRIAITEWAKQWKPKRMDGKPVFSPPIQEKELAGLLWECGIREYYVEKAREIVREKLETMLNEFCHAKRCADCKN